MVKEWRNILLLINVPKIRARLLGIAIARALGISMDKAFQAAHLRLPVYSPSKGRGREVNIALSLYSQNPSSTDGGSGKLRLANCKSPHVNSDKDCE